MVEPRDKLIRHLVGKDQKTRVQLHLKTASIFGLAGMGKTTLADLVYDAIGDKFQSRAFVFVNPGGKMREVLARIIEQVVPNSSVPLAGTQASMEEHLKDILSNFLKDKRCANVQF
jgi:Holliday junction resolvasome RuvABC ATP-dependent DNA helicase subunit